MFNVSSGRVVEFGRPIKSNFREQGFTTFLDAGVPNDLLERAFVSVERRVLNEIRTVGVGRRGPRQKADVANLFAIHLVRSPAFKSFHRHIGERFRDGDVIAYASSAEVPPNEVPTNGLVDGSRGHAQDPEGADDRRAKDGAKDKGRTAILRTVTGAGPAAGARHFSRERCRSASGYPTWIAALVLGMATVSWPVR